MNSRHQVRKLLRETARRFANRLVALSDYPTRLTEVQHEALLDGLDHSAQPVSDADQHLREAVGLLIPENRPSAGWVRVGGPADGGYVMANDLTNTVAVSLGVGWDDSWEISALEGGAVAVAQFDPTIRRPPHALHNTSFHRKGVAAVTDETQSAVSLEKALDLADPSGNKEFVLKMDIEGSEWSVFDAAPADWGRRVRQLAVEIHELRTLVDEERAEEIVRVLRKISETHAPVHLQANNAVRLARLGRYSVPDALEVTWVRRDLVESCPTPTTLWHELSARNDPRLPIVSLDGWLK